LVTRAAVASIITATTRTTITTGTTRLTMPAEVASRWTMTSTRLLTFRLGNENSFVGNAEE
jgi:hypothetical protein